MSPARCWAGDGRWWPWRCVMRSPECVRPGRQIRETERSLIKVMSGWSCGNFTKHQTRTAPHSMSLSVQCVQAGHHRGRAEMWTLLLMKMFCVFYTTINTIQKSTCLRAVMGRVIPEQPLEQSITFNTWHLVRTWGRKYRQRIWPWCDLFTL